ncbi:transcription factor TFIIIC subunit tfc4 [Lobulomyces angularis]|nr:transcription factor TFIIIC subunit tfc4 [Lobulomyces angularis]
MDDIENTFEDNEDEELEAFLPEDIEEIVRSTTNDLNVDVSNYLFKDEIDFKHYEEDGSKKKLKTTYLERRALTALPEEQRLRMGEANGEYMSGDVTKAAEIVLDILKTSPNYPEPWISLGSFWEDIHPKKSFAAYLCAALLKRKDADLWRRLYKASLNAKQTSQALFCLQKLVSSDPTDVEAIWDLSFSYYEQGRYHKAINGYLSILKHAPFNMDVIQEVVKIYIKVRDVHSAIALYEQVFDADKSFPLSKQQAEEADEEWDDDDEEVVSEFSLGSRMICPNFRMNYELLNKLAGFYLEIGDSERAIFVIKEGCRRLKGTSNCLNSDSIYYIADFDQAMADLDDTDEEFDIPGEPQEVWVPIQLRIQLGVSRLRLNQSQTAGKHFNCLFNYEPEKFSELYIMVVDAYMKHRMYTNALQILNYKNEMDNESCILTCSKMAECHQNLGNLVTCAKLLELVIELDPNDNENKLKLAEAYEDLGEDEKALVLIREVDLASKLSANVKPKKRTHSRYLMKKKKVLKEPQQNMESEKSDGSYIEEEELDETSEEMESTINVEGMDSKAERNRKNFEKKIFEAERIKENIKESEKLEFLYNKIFKDRISMVNYLRTSRNLTSKFISHSYFFNKKDKRSTSFSNIEKYYVQTFFPKKVDDENTGEQKESTMFQGLTMDRWYEIFFKQALILTKTGRSEDAQQIFNVMSDCHCFNYNEDRRLTLKLHQLASAVYLKDYYRAVEVLRWLLHVKCGFSDIFRLYNATFNGADGKSVPIYASAMFQKFLHREMKLKIEKNIEDPVFFIFYGHHAVMGKSYEQAIGFFFQAYKSVPDDPMLNLSIGYSFIAASLSRRCLDRHMYLLKGFTFFFKYFDVLKSIGKEQEAHYNLARAFHQTGNLFLAVPYYQKVLQLSELPSNSSKNESFDLKYEAAYNLHLIYCSNGSYGLAEYILKQYCTI